MSIDLSKVTEHVDRCATCNKDLRDEIHYFMCDEHMACYCAEHWEAVNCELEHGEGCATSVFQSED